MIKEAYVSFEIAKLLKEKGFNCECYWYYPINGGEIRELTLDELNYHRSQFIKAPTHQMALAWLRKEHQIAIVIDIWFGKPLYCNWYGKIFCYDDNLKSQQDVKLNTETSYEEAVEAAILYTLENIL